MIIIVIIKIIKTTTIHIIKTKTNLEIDQKIISMSNNKIHIRHQDNTQIPNRKIDTIQIHNSNGNKKEHMEWEEEGEEEEEEALTIIIFTIMIIVNREIGRISNNHRIIIITVLREAEGVDGEQGEEADRKTPSSKIIE